MATGWRKKLAPLRAWLGVRRAPKNRGAKERPSWAALGHALWGRVAGWPRPSWRSVAFAGLALVACLVTAQGVRHRQAALEVVREHPYFRVERIEIRGAGPLVDEGDLRQWLGIREGDSLWEATPQSVEARLRAHPMLRSAVVRRVFPGTLDIEVGERQPAAITVLDELYYLDRDGESFGPLGPAHDRNYPIFTGAADGADGQRRWALRRALQLLKRSESREVELDVSELHLDPDDGLVLFLAEPRLPIYLGWSAWERRLERAERVLASWSESAGQLARVDLRFRDQVVVGLREPRGIRISGENRGQVST